MNLKHIVSAIFERYEVNIGSEAKKWQIFPYRQYQDERYTGRLVFGGHVVRLKHAESGGFINIDDEGRLATGDMQGYLRIYTGPQTGEDADEQMSTNSLFEIEYDTDQEHGRATVWEDDKTGQPIRYRFRHLNSGRVLTVKTITKNGKDIHILTSGHTLNSNDVLPGDKRPVNTTSEQ